MVKNEELIKFVFKESDKINYSEYSINFLEQILNSDSSFILDTDSRNDLYAWKNGVWKNGVWKKGVWEKGVWENGVWKNGIWKNGIWRYGTWEKGTWQGGIWEDGTWKNRLWKNGKWRNGTWKNGIWIKGKIYNKNTKQYQEYDLPPNLVEWSYSYGKK